MSVDGFRTGANQVTDNVPAKVWLVWADTLYEGSALVRVYASEKAAEAFCDRCLAHQAKKPPLPEDYGVNYDNVDAWCDAYDKWRAKHPAKYHSNYHTFSVSTEKVYG